MPGEVLQRYGLIAREIVDGGNRVKFWCCTAHRDFVWVVGLGIYASANGVSAAKPDAKSEQMLKLLPMLKRR